MVVLPRGRIKQLAVSLIIASSFPRASIILAVEYCGKTSQEQRYFSRVQLQRTRTGSRASSNDSTHTRNSVSLDVHMFLFTRVVTISTILSLISLTFSYTTNKVVLIHSAPRSSSTFFRRGQFPFHSLQYLFF